MYQPSLFLGFFSLSLLWDYYFLLGPFYMASFYHHLVKMLKSVFMHQILTNWSFLYFHFTRLILYDHLVSFALSMNTLVGCVEGLVSVKVDPFFRTAFWLSSSWCTFNVVRWLPDKLMKQHKGDDEDEDTHVDEEAEQEKRILPPDKVIVTVCINEEALD